MTNVNNFAIIGHLTADAEEFNIGNNTYVSFRVAVNRGQNKDASFIPVRAPKKFISDTLRAKLTKGASVLVSGRFESGHYEKDGQKKFYDYLSAATIQHDVNGGFSEGLLMGNLTADVVTRNTQNGGRQVVGYVTDEQAFDAARADVQARLTGVAGWNVQPAYTLVMADADTRPMTERETADAILRAAGGEITEGTAVYLDGALRFVTDEGDHLRQFLYAVRAPWQTDGVQTDFVHALRLVDGIYPAAAITPYRDLTAALRADDLLQVKAVRYETVTRELPFETQTIEDAGLDFGKTETVQAGQNGSELVTSEITTVAGEVVSTRVVDVQLVQASVPEVIHRGTRLKSGMIGRLGTGSFLWPVPGYSGISRWASLPYGHRGVDITAPYGTPIYAADAGTVIAAQWHNHPTMSWGYYVEIDHGNGYKTLYAHMSSFVVQAGQTVEKGQLIGYVGATGAATGPHCHFEMYYNNALISARNVFPDM